ncbi:MAG: hypothetical protein IKX78_00780 [Clostridia bacterium]|nr:hypothetical protein [Clostridia bacterium]
MNKLFLVLGIILVSTGAVLLLFAAFNLFGYRHVLDGSQELYRRLHSRMTVCGISGTALALAGAVCFAVRLKTPC